MFKSPVARIVSTSLYTKILSTFTVRIAKTMAVSTTSIEFEKSYAEYEQYPTQLIYNTSYPSTLELKKVRLDSAASKLCIQDATELDVGFRDFETWDDKCSIPLLVI
jgi:hypothetical protein